MKAKIHFIYDYNNYYVKSAVSKIQYCPFLCVLSKYTQMATTATLIINAGVGYTYGDPVTVNGATIATGVKWVGGNPPPSTANDDILTFSIIRDSTGVTRVYCSSSINIS